MIAKIPQIAGVLVEDFVIKFLGVVGDTELLEVVNVVID